MGLKVGVLDADIYGPSIPTMLGNAGKTPLIESENFVPLDAYGMAVLSIGHLTGDNNTPVAWRGPKATGALMQLFNQTLWPDLDVLMIDMPRVLVIFNLRLHSVFGYRLNHCDYSPKCCLA